MDVARWIGARAKPGARRLGGFRPAAYACVLAISCACFGCTVHPGLSNAPSLGTLPAPDVRVHDVVANGRDSCERRDLAGSPLRGHWPPCSGEHEAVRASWPAPLPAPHPSGWIDPVPGLVRWPYCSDAALMASNRSLGPLSTWTSLSCRDGIPDSIPPL